MASTSRSATEGADTEEPVAPKPPKRSRSSSRYNNFCRSDSKREGETGKDQLNRWKDTWRGFTEDQKKSFESHSRRVPEKESPETQWKRNWEFTISYIEYCDAILPTPAFIIYQDPITRTVKLCGTDDGLHFAENQSAFIARFQSYLGDIEEGRIEPKRKLEKEVRALFNQLYRSATGTLKPLPYARVRQQGIAILGLEDIGLDLKPPSSYGQKQQRLILDNAEKLKCVIKSQQLVMAGSSTTSPVSSASTSAPPTASSTSLSTSTPASPTASKSSSTSSAPPTASKSSSTSSAPPTASKSSSAPPTATKSSSASSSAPPTASKSSSTSSSAPPTASKTLSMSLSTSTPAPPTASESSSTSSSTSTPAPSTKSKSSSTSSSTSSAAVSTPIMLSHPCGVGHIRAPIQTTHVVLDQSRLFIEAACLLGPPHKFDDERLLVRVIKSYTDNFAKDMFYLVSKQLVCTLVSNQ